ncbi:pyridoxine/pyridoxamine 5'-phosphate oxidase [Frondihabitans australicus]|uniref:Pyridoxamine 5'-phosphate oxidase n=1 Tax=Frondihabitans australicus TaxID=386892 RepID=A0A495IFF7_9MICO|nr:pyridoxal 5'-phosphate synthase [Frondihabitans australicus]RKR73786.1 pyridoxamine 5'-phosphate oxidase [Frondihabitans australicus]
MSIETRDIRRILRQAKTFPPDMPAFDADAAPDEPLGLLVDWLSAAIEAGVNQPHAMTLSTCDSTGHVTARTLLLKDVDDALWFASSDESPKGRQMAENPHVALTLYWREQGRQIRVEGQAQPGPAEVGAADFTARHPDSRAVAIALPQSSAYDPGSQEPQARLAAARELVAQDDDFAPDDWTAYRVVPTVVEFWQATTGRDQVRLRYDRVGEGTGWTSTRLWP